MNIGEAPMPDIVGAVDGSLINMKEPSTTFMKKLDIEEIAVHYKCRKLQYAVVLQAICDADLHFIDCFAGYPGSVGDYRIFRNSNLYREVCRDFYAFFPNGEFIVGNKAYPVLTWCIPPFRNNGRFSHEQIKFNKVVSQKRQVIERAFVLLKERFRRLKFLDMSRLDLVSYFIIAACVPHNICLKGIDDDVEEFIEKGRELDEESNDNNDTIEIVNREYVENNNRQYEFNDGEIKRNYLCLRVAGRQ
ncbi:protein ALP1-like [Monomorium pharaonis]|uniref:protein ALP1-like n=1 Tax=Monomorium pharaonis TaxID=307658 RepID=UPI001746CFBC|nr:protein ALP1-like [Monomorium pharaonis]